MRRPPDSEIHNKQGRKRKIFSFDDKNSVSPSLEQIGQPGNKEGFNRHREGLSLPGRPSSTEKIARLPPRGGSLNHPETSTTSKMQGMILHTVARTHVGNIRHSSTERAKFQSEGSPAMRSNPVRGFSQDRRNLGELLRKGAEQKRKKLQNDLDRVKSSTEKFNRMAHGILERTEKNSYMRKRVYDDDLLAEG